MMLQLKRICALGAICVSALCSRSNAREWTDVTGKYTCAADLEAVQADVAKLRKTDGRLVRVRMQSLSAADREYVAQRVADCSAARAWTLATGKELWAEFVSSDNGIVTLKKLAGDLSQVAWEELGSADREYIAQAITEAHRSEEKNMPLARLLQGPPAPAGFVAAVQDPFESGDDPQADPKDGNDKEGNDKDEPSMPDEEKSDASPQDSSGKVSEQMLVDVRSFLKSASKVELLVGYKKGKRSAAHEVCAKLAPKDGEGTILHYSNQSSFALPDGVSLIDDLYQIQVLHVVFKGKDEDLKSAVEAFSDTDIFEFIEPRRVEILPPVIVEPPKRPPGQKAPPAPPAPAPAPAAADDKDQAAPPAPEQSGDEEVPTPGPEAPGDRPSSPARSPEARRPQSLGRPHTSAVARTATNLQPSVLYTTRSLADPAGPKPFYDRGSLRPHNGRTPNDPLYDPWQWGLGVIRAPRAWCTTRTSDIVVAVLDSGIDYGHEDIAHNSYVHNAWYPNDNLSAYQRVHGYDFVNEDDDPQDDHGHGTHVAGIIGAVGGNCVGVSGIAQTGKLMAVKVSGTVYTQEYNQKTKVFEKAWHGTSEPLHEARGLIYAVDNRAWVVNISLGTKPQATADASKTLKRALDYAEAHGLLVVVSAGNDASDNDGPKAVYPASYPNKNIISVANLGIDGKLAKSSCFGKTTVDIAAPGSTVLSTISRVNKFGTNGAKKIGDYKIPPRYEFSSGTSMAAPMVAGAAALVWGHPAHRQLTATQVKEIILRNARPLESLTDKCVTGAVLDIGFLGDMVTCESCKCHCCVERRQKCGISCN